ncbi:MAG: branched-chain amino acid ABC transporter permease [Candidatus Zixiibacteriota bacterium]|jgi:branched-chain amino acid transport system permease protein
MFLQQLINGLTIGAVYALIAVGYTMVYGIVELINFAHGEIYMMATFVAMTLFRSAGYPLWVAAPAAIVSAMIIGVTLEYIAYRPLRQSPRLVALISAIGASLFLQNLAMKIWGARRQPFLDPSRPLEFFQIKHQLSLPLLGDATFSNMQLTILGTAAAMMIFLHLLINKTKLGKAMRACAQDQVAAKLMGVNVDRTITATFAIGSAMAAVAGVLVGMNYNQVWPMMGYMAGLKAFTAAVLGGIGNMPGAFVGGLVLGLAEGFAGAYISSLWMDAIAFAILIIVLIYRPSGLLGKQIPRRT